MSPFLDNFYSTDHNMSNEYKKLLDFIGKNVTSQWLYYPKFIVIIDFGRVASHLFAIILSFNTEDKISSLKGKIYFLWHYITLLFIFINQ